MNWLEQFVQQSQAATNEALGRMAAALACLTKDSADTVTASTGTARSLAYQFGVPPEAGTSAVMAPRQLTAVPAVYEGLATAQADVDILHDTGRYVSAGWFANLGDDPFQVVLIGISGPSGAITLPSAASFQLPCLISGFHVLPLDGKAAAYQAVLS